MEIWPNVYIKNKKDYSNPVIHVKDPSMMKKRVSAHLKILGIISSCGGGDWPPLLSLALGMKARGHDVLMVCDKGTKTAVLSAGLSALCLPPGLDLSGFFNPALQIIFNTGEPLTPMTPNPLLKWAKKTAVYVEKKLGIWRPDWILGSLLCIELGRMMAEKCKCPWCFVNPGFHFGDTTNRPRKEDFSYIGALMYEHWLLPPLQKATLVLHATDPMFDKGSGSLPSNHFYTGPLFWEMPAPVPTYLHDPGPPWILISLSTAPQEDDIKIVQASLSALENQPLRVIVTLPPGQGQIPFSTLPDNVFMERYIPHSVVLQISTLAICHAGHGIVIKSIYYGTPMVLVPWGRDQPGVASRAKAMGVASVVHRNDCNASTLQRAIQKTMASPEIGLRSRCESHRLKKINSLEFACTRLENINNQ